VFTIIDVCELPIRAEPRLAHDGTREPAMLLRPQWALLRTIKAMGLNWRLSDAAKSKRG
jgi:hypothetical protein